MKSNSSIDVYYDETTDFLEVSFGSPPETEYTEDLEEEILVTKDRKTNEVKSIGILNFKTRAKESIVKRVLARLGMSMPLNITFFEN